MQAFRAVPRLGPPFVWHAALNTARYIKTAGRAGQKSRKLGTGGYSFPTR
jgi:hypothetical protein